MSHRDHQHYILGLEILVQRDVSRLTARNHKLPKVVLRGAADEGMSLQDSQALEDDLFDRECGRRILVGQEFEEAIEIGVGASGNF